MNKKHTILFCFIFFTFTPIWGQHKSRLTFDYDPSGNQIKRELICLGLGCEDNLSTMKNTRLNSSSDTNNEDISNSKWTSSLENFELKYYPNPVQEILTINWEDLQNDLVIRLELYSINGQLLKSYPIYTSYMSHEIPFYNYSPGRYNIVVIYKKREKQTLQIIKK